MDADTSANADADTNEDAAANAADKSWLRTPLTDSKDIAHHYDDWVPTYDAQLASWGYPAPEHGAALLAQHLASRVDTPVLDVGCGTGLTGSALSTHGFGIVDGIDLSSKSLEAARQRGVYRNLDVHDFNADPLPRSGYGAAYCIGVLSYAHEPLRVIRDVLRVLKPGGVFVFTHRTDLWESQALGPALMSIVDSPNDMAAQVSWSEPEPYMPNNPDFADKVLIRYVTLIRS